MLRLTFVSLASTLILTLVFLAGCGETKSPQKAINPEKDTTSKVGAESQKSTAPGKDDEHGHKPTTHGGTLISIGSDSYHAEAVFEKGGILRLYTLGKDEATILEVENQTLTGFAKAKGSAESESFVLTAKPQPGDKEGMTSLFMGQLPKGVASKPVDVTIPAIRIGKERFRLAFQSTSNPTDQAFEHSFPAKVVKDEETKLYLTPGGKYTEADIKANGNKTASQKFEGIKAEHDSKPKQGDKICPISLTKANPKFSWIINGQSYEFCCPPCVDEFLLLAKEKPGELKPEEHYRQK